MTAPVLIVDLGLDATNEDILEQMRVMKRAREEGFYKHVVCGVRNFGDDPRELYEIAEVRAFCRRLVNLGFISYLDFSTVFVPDLPPVAKKGWGAAEVWLCGEGRLEAQNPLDEQILDELKQAVMQSNAKADKALGPMK
jgi:hypothetical protein